MGDTIKVKLGEANCLYLADRKLFNKFGITETTSGNMTNLEFIEIIKQCETPLAIKYNKELEEFHIDHPYDY